MPDIPYKVPGTGETRYKHITSGQQRLMAKMNWDRAVARARAEKLKKEKDSESSDKEQPCIDWDSGNLILRPSIKLYVEK